MGVTPPTYRNTRGCLLSIYFLQQLLVTLFILLLVVERISVASGRDMKKTSDDNDNDNNDISHWQRCSVFIAPSLLTGEQQSRTVTTENELDANPNSDPYSDVNFNWGVYANRDFSKGEIVDISPLTVPIPDRSQIIEKSILNDYVYGYWRVIKPKHPTNVNAKPTIEKLYSVLFGPDMFYNHHPILPNIEFSTFGREPDASSGVPYAINPQGFVAKRSIKRGEELFTSYNGKEDGGTQWFQRRGITMITPPSLSLSSTTKIEEFDLHADQYCSKIYSGLGIPSWKDRLLTILPTNYDLPFYQNLKWLAPNFDAGLWDAKTKIDVKKGERLEVSTALVLSLKFTKNTAIMPLVYTWKDLHNDHRSALERLHEKDDLRLQYQGPDTNWRPMNNITTTITTVVASRTISNFEDLALFPVAGNIGMIRRRTPTSSDAAKANCRLLVHDSNNNLSTSSRLKHPVGVTIELIAMEDLITGSNLIVDVIESVATPLEYRQLYRELKLTGQPYNKQIFQHRQRQRRNRTEASTSTSKTPTTITTTTTTTAKVEL